MRQIVRHDLDDHITGTLTGQLDKLTGKTTYLNAECINEGVTFSGPVTVDPVSGAYDFAPAEGDYDVSGLYSAEIEAVATADPTQRITWQGGLFAIVDDIANAPITSSMGSSGTTLVGPTSLDTHGNALGELPIGTRVGAYVGTVEVASTIVVADGTWGLTLADGTTYALIGVKSGQDNWEREVSLP